MQPGKSAPGDVLVQAIRLVMAGGTYLPAAAAALRHSISPGSAPADPVGDSLTSRQLRVLRLLTQGLSNKQIARDLEISEITVKAHVSAIFRKLEVSNRTQAANAARSLLNDDLGVRGSPSPPRPR